MQPLLPDDDPTPLRLFFDPRGRLGRRDFWLCGVLALGALNVFVRALLDIARVRSEIFVTVVDVLLAWPAIAISAKRWHDRDRSGWWVLISLVPVVGWLWMLVDNGFKRGTPQANRFGPLPRRIG
ncbi:MAG: DUF805 domain-containing protein [Burkholderiales bacterium]|nr:DUF805 domain-containing protein [Burkholderiales bacterium]MDE2395385.1 DUF805 domain-containing protein [Burkholderiales bacterium]MDE2455106.1 DUF805 domain-containing protein [Burkholderiales bacterium]